MALLKPKVPVINWSNPLTKGLISCFPFFEGGGSSTLDIFNKQSGAFGFDNGGGDLGGVPVWANDIFGRCISFAGASKISIKGVVSNMTTAYTLAVFVKRSAVTVRGNMFRSDIGGEDKLWFNFQSDNTIRIYMAETTPNATATASIGTDNNWHLAMATYNGSTVNIYFDGILKATQGVTGTISPGALSIGQGSGTGSITGLMANALIWKRSLTSSEAKQLYTNPFQIYRKSSFLKNPMFKLSRLTP